MMVLGEFYTFHEKIIHPRKAQKAQKVTFFILDVFMRIKQHKTYLLFMVFALVGSFRKRFKTPRIPSSNILLGRRKTSRPEVLYKNMCS